MRALLIFRGAWMMDVEDYKILMRLGYSRQAGIDGNGRRVKEYVIAYETPAGRMSSEEWKDGRMDALERCGVYGKILAKRIN